MIKTIMAMISPVYAGLFTFWGGSGGGGGGNSTSTVKNAPADQVLPYLDPYMQKAASLANQSYQPYQGQQIAGLDANQLQGNALTANQALNGFQGQQDAGNFYQNLMQGKFGDPASNPYLQANADYAMNSMANAYQNGTASQNNADFARAGAFGGSAWGQQTQANNKTFADSLGNAANQFYGQNYANNMNNMMQGLGMAPTMQNMGYTDASKLTAVGDANRQYQQDLLNQAQTNYNNALQYPYQQLDVMGNAIRATMGAGSSSTSSQSNSYKPSPMAGAIGGGLGGYALGSAFGNGALGAGMGALGGLLL